MASIPPVLLVLDIGALSSATPREWLEFSRVGNCIIPQAVYEEMKFLFDRSPDPDLERVSRAFSRFFPTSGWQISEASAHHATLKSGSGQSLTKRSRISLAVGRCAYALSQENAAKLVVLVSSDRDLLQRVYDTQAPNLSPITGPALLQWCRTGQRPIAVSQKLQQLRTGGGAVFDPSATGSSSSGTPSRITSNPSRLTSTNTTRIQPKKTVIQDMAPSLPSWLPQAFSLLSSLLLLVLAGVIAWNVMHSVNWQNDWRDNSGEQKSP